MAITKRRSKKGIRYQVKLRGDDGKWVSETFGTLKEAKLYENNQISKKLKGQTLNGDAHKVSLNDFFTMWMASSCQASFGWKKKQKQMFRDYIAPEIGSLKITRVKAAHISKILQNMQELGRGEQTRRHVYNLLHKIFDDCIQDYEYISYNPVKRKLIPKLHKKEQEHLDYEEVVFFLKYVRSLDFGLAIWIQLLAGLRACEICYLRWSKHIDFKNSEIKIRGTYRRSEKRFVNFPKGKDWHSVKIPHELLLFLKEAKLRSKSDWVVTSLTNTQNPMSYNSYLKVLKRHTKNAEINPNIATHNLRHSTHSIYMSNGATEEDMQLILGHKCVTTTRRYIHGRHRAKKRVEEITESVEIFSSRS